MKVIDQSPLRADVKTIDRLKAHFQGISSFGWAWEADVKSEETIVDSIRKYLDNKFFIIRHVLLEGVGVPIPLVLVGPTGVYVLYASGVKGVFRAKNETWLEMNKGTRRYVLSRKNLITRTQMMTKVVDIFLTNNQCPHPPILPGLLFGDAGAHVDSVRPAVRIVLKDGIERFTTSVIQSQAVFNANEIRRIVDTLTGQTAKEEEISAEEADASPKLAVPRQPTPVDRLVSSAKKMGWSKRQWVLLGAAVFFQVIILILFFVFIMVVFG